MPTYKLYYFDSRGRAEPMRLLFAYKGIKYEDIRLAGEKWAEFKPKTPFGVMPVLEEDGKMLGGSNTILRYLAEKPEFNLAGSNAWENAQLASIADFINDFLTEVFRVFFEKDEEKKKVLYEKLVSEGFPKYLGKLENMADSGYLFGGRLTWPDLLFFCMFQNMVRRQPELADAYPNLNKLKTNIETDSNIAKWIAERPQTQF